jgi:nucleotide-binding universal stress UspA family protein
MLTTINTILYATDLGKEAGAALSMVMSLAEKYQARVICLHVIEPINIAVYNWSSLDSWKEIQETNFQQSEKMLNDQLTQFLDQQSDADISIDRPETKVINGHVSQSILEYADKVDADIIIMGSHGHGVLGELLLGSVADKVMRLSQRPVLLVPVKSNG